MCQSGVFDAFRHRIYRFPPAGAAPTENESQLAQKCHIRLKTAKSVQKWRKMHKKVQKRRKTTLWAAPAVAKRYMACRNVPLTDNVSKNLGKDLQFVGNP